MSKFPNPRNFPRNLTRTNDLEPIVHSQDIRTFFFDPSTHFVLRTIIELIKILYIVFCFCHIILNTHSTSNKYMYIKKMCKQMIISSFIILFYKLCTFKKKKSNFHRMYFLSKNNSIWYVLFKIILNCIEFTQKQISLHAYNYLSCIPVFAMKYINIHFMV